MKVLLSAYACEPGKGSEPGVGWHWAVEIARLGHEVWVLTRENNRTAIEEAFARQTDLPMGLRFVYYDLPAALRFWKRGLRGVHFYYFLWQIGAFFKARALYRDIPFDRVHHITFVSARQPSFMGLLGPPFIFGPLAGGERIPGALRHSLPLRARLREWLRDMANAWASVDPLMRLALSRAERIYVTSRDGLNLLPARFRGAARVQPAIGIEWRSAAGPREAGVSDGLRLLYVGNLLYLKGIHLALAAFAHLLREAPASRLTIVGQGPDEHWLRGIARELGIEKAVDWLPQVPREQLIAHYTAHDAFIFPSLRDSGGMVVLEALACGLPVICLNLGGPGAIVTETAGYIVDVHGKTEAEVVASLAGCLKALWENPGRRQTLALGALSHSRNYSWLQRVRQIYPPASGR